MPDELPSGALLVDLSARYNHDTIPRSLARFLPAPRGCWARVVVEKGGLELAFPGGTPSQRLDSMDAGIVPPGTPFKIAPTEKPLRFQIEYYRKPRLGDGEDLAAAMGR